MSILHDAYLFKLEDFAVTATPYLKALATNSKGYSQLRAAAIQLYDSIPRVKKLAIEYGSWDKVSLLTFPLDHPKSPDDIFFWFSLILYNQFKSRPGDLGLGSHWRLLNEILLRLGWEEVDRNLVIHGFSFTRFAQEWLEEHASSVGRIEPSVDYWNDFHPYSTGAQSGWLDLDSIDKLLVNLLRDQARLAGVHEQLDIARDIQEAYQAALEMLTAAKENHYDLYLITSG